uniref:Major facilitator superfamily (MFS) profile domain-containing protein n=1 Tax=Bionectria ochroleuca TaxID=29856 RepID=A0A0B7KFE0_BIOOC
MSPLTRLPGSLASLKLNWTTALVVSVCVVDSVTIAYDGSLMGSLNVMETYHNYFQLTTTTTAINTCATFLGAILVGPFTGILIDRNAARIVIGVGVGLGQTAASTYVAETTAPRIRSFALGLYFSCWAVGALLAAGVSYGGAMPLLIVPLLYYIPESPRWLAFRDRREEALAIISKINGKPEDDEDVQLQFQEIVASLNHEKAQSMSLKAIVRKPNRRRLLLALSVAPLAMLTGSNVITYYFGSMLTQAGIGNPTTQLQINVVLSSWQLVVAITGSSLAEKLGRRFLALFSLGTCSAFFYILAGLTAKYGTAGDKAGTYGTVACIFLFLGAYAFGITPLTAMYAPEVLSYNMRANGIAMQGILIKSCGVLVTLAFPYMLESIGWKSYIINASWNILLWLYIWFQWVETKGLTLEEVDRIFDGEVLVGAPVESAEKGEVVMSEVKET